MRLSENFSGAKSDQHLVELWLCGRPETTAKSYRSIATAFLASLSTALPQTTVADIAAWVKGLEGSEGYKAQQVVVAKSLLSFAERTGYCVFNVGMVLRIPKQKRTLHKRIVSLEVVQELIAAAPAGRDRVFIKFLYASACRVSEAVGLEWEDLGEGVVTLHGKGGKTRTVPVPQSVLDELIPLKPIRPKTQAVFRSIRGLRLTVRDAQRIVEKARGEVTTKKISPHWLRHCHATEALSKGCPIHVLSGSLGHANVATTSVYLHIKPGEGSSQWLAL